MRSRSSQIVVVAMTFLLKFLGGVSGVMGDDILVFRVEIDTSVYLYSMYEKEWLNSSGSADFIRYCYTVK